MPVWSATMARSTRVASWLCGSAGGDPMSRGKPWYKRYPADFIAGTAMMTAEEKGVYSTIIDMLFDRGGPVPDAPADLARICGCATPKRFVLIRDRLVALGKLTVASGHITNARFERDRSRTEKTDQGVGDGPPTDPPNSRGDLFENNDLAAPLYQKPEARNKLDTKPVAWFDGFLLTADRIAYAKSKVPEYTAEQIVDLFERFRDHHIAKGSLWAGERGWNAAWQNWCRNELRFKGSRNGQANAQRGGQGRSGPAGSGHRTSNSDAINAGMGAVARKYAQPDLRSGEGNDPNAAEQLRITDRSRAH
jgi:hypothetical protein